MRMVQLWRMMYSPVIDSFFVQVQEFDLLKLVWLHRLAWIDCLLDHNLGSS
jgi:hypothetical protein